MRLQFSPLACTSVALGAMLAASCQTSPTSSAPSADSVQVATEQTPDPRWTSPPSPALIEARRNAVHAAVNAVTFRSMDRFYPTATVNTDAPTKLPYNLKPLAPDVAFADETLPFQDALKRTYTNAILVMQDSEIVYEQYLNGGSEDDRFMSWSVAKSITSLMFGKLLEDGAIGSVNDTVESYLPNLRGTAYEGVTLEQLLMMRAGTSYIEQSPFGQSTLDKAKERSVYGNQTWFANPDGLGIEKKEPPGSRFNYSTFTTGIIGLVLEAASGKSYAQLTEEILWKPMHMEQSGYWVLDGPLPEGHAVAGGGFNATVRDYARIGQMVLQGGEFGGTQIISNEWIEQSTRYTGNEPVIPGAPRGYQYQWWTMMGTQHIEALGIHGQFLSIDPETNTVIVRMGHWPEPGGAKYNLDVLAMHKAIRAELTSGE